MKYVREIILVLIVLEIFLASFLVYHDFFTSNVGCFGGGSCEEVQTSEYGEIFGIKVSLFGLVSFVLLLIVTLLSYYKGSNWRNFMTVMIGLGSLFSLYFLFLQFFVLGKICSSCVVVDGVMIVIAILYFFFEK